MTKQALSNDAKTKTKKTPVKVGSKSSSSASSSLLDDDVIGKHKTSMSVAAGGKKKHASSLRPAVVVPKGWPVSSQLTYPAPSCCIGGKTKDDTGIMDVDSDDDDDIDHIPSKKKNNYLTPGNLLQQSCNGSDVFLRKRAVQSTSSLCPSFATASSSSAGGGGGGGTTRFLIVFPGRMSLKAPPPPPPTSSNNNTTTHTTSNDIENINSEHNEDQQNGDNTEQPKDDTKTTEKKKNPFAPTHPPHLLGKLTTSLTKEGCMELRIPLPSNAASSASASSSASSSSNEHEIVMSGRAIPLSGKYMALSFKRTGGSKESASSGGGGGGLGGGNNKKRGTGSIICKDVFRSVIVLGDSKVLDGDGKTVSLEGLMQTQRDSNDENGLHEMLHYGGSDRALDGGGKYNNGINGGGSRKSLNGGKTTASTAASFLRKDSISSKESDVDSDDSDAMDVEDDKNGDSSDTDEFVPISAKKRKLTTGSTQKRGAKKDEEDDDDDVEELTPARKRTPRRSVESSKKISYVDKSSSDEDELDSSDEDEDDSDNDDAYKPNRSKKVTEKPAVKKGSSASKSVAKTNNISSKSVAKPGSSVKKRTPVLSVDSSEEENDTEEQIKQSSVRQSKKSTPTTNGGSSGTVRRQGSSAAKNVNFSPTNDIINVDSDDDEEDETAKKDELHAISVNARKRLATATNTTLSTNQSPLKKLSPISRGRRKKNSPTKSPTMTKDNDDDLSLGDDDPFSFL